MVVEAACPWPWGQGVPHPASQGDRPQRQDFGETAVGCWAAALVPQCFCLSNKISPCLTEKGVVRTEPDDKHEKHPGNCKIFSNVKCFFYYLFPCIECDLIAGWLCLDALEGATEEVTAGPRPALPGPGQA